MDLAFPVEESTDNYSEYFSVVCNHLSLSKAMMTHQFSEFRESSVFFYKGYSACQDMVLYTEFA